jgi:propanediol dehydratase small subunit
MNSYQVLISDIRVFKITVQADSIEAANELADVALESGYEEHAELVEVRDPSVDDVFEDLT